MRKNEKNCCYSKGRMDDTWDDSTCFFRRDTSSVKNDIFV